MHRTFSLPRLLGWWSLLVALGLQVGIHSAGAQNPIQPVTSAPDHHAVIEIPVGASRPCQMTTRADLKRVENPNSNIVRVERIADRNNEILLVAESPGRTLITFVDQKDRVEMHEVVVAAAAQPVPVPGAAVEVKQVTIQLGLPDPRNNNRPSAGFKTERLREPPAGQLEVDDKDIVEVVPKGPKDHPLEVTFKGLREGRTKARYFADAAKTRGEVFEITVVGPERAGVHQVELQVVVAVVNRSLARNMSFSFLSSNNNWFMSSLIGGPGTLASGLVVPPTAVSMTGTGGNLPFGILNGNGGHIAFLNALRTEGLTKILSEPRIVTLSGKSGRFVSGGKVDIVAAGGVSSAQISAEFGTIVNFLPIVLGNGKIHLEVAPEVSTPTNTIPIPGAGGPGTVSFSVLKRSASVAVQLEDGQTLAIGGLIQNRVDATNNKVPVLGDMPFFGAAFRSVTFTETEEEMIILVTPRLVDGVDCTRIPKHLPGRETRIVDDYELFLEGILEAPRRPRNVIFHPTQYKGAHTLSPSMSQYPCGDGRCGREGCSTCGSWNHHGSPAGQSRVATPTTASVPAIPTSNSRVIVESEVPGSLPPIREANPGLGPVTPTAPGAAAPQPRQYESRPLVPPVGPGGPFSR